MTIDDIVTQTLDSHQMFQKQAIYEYQQIRRRAKFTEGDNE